MGAAAGAWALAAAASTAATAATRTTTEALEIGAIAGVLFVLLAGTGGGAETDADQNDGLLRVRPPLSLWGAIRTRRRERARRRVGVEREGEEPERSSAVRASSRLAWQLRLRAPPLPTSMIRSRLVGTDG